MAEFSVQIEQNTLPLPSETHLKYEKKMVEPSLDFSVTLNQTVQQINCFGKSSFGRIRLSSKSCPTLLILMTSLRAENDGPWGPASLKSLWNKPHSIQHYKTSIILLTLLGQNLLQFTNGIHEVRFRIFYIFFASKRTTEKYCYLTNWTTKFNVIKLLSLITKIVTFKITIFS